MKTRDLIKNYCSNNPKVIVKIVLLMLASLTLLIAFPLLMKFIIEMFESILQNKAAISELDAFIYQDRIEALNAANKTSMITSIILVISLGIDVILSFLVNTTLDNTCSKFGSEITEMLRNNAYSSLLRGEYLEINEMNTDDVITTLLDSTDTIGNKYFANHILKLINYASTFLASLIVLFVFNVTAGLIVLGTVPFIYLATRYIGKFISKQNEKYESLEASRDLEIKNNIQN